MKKKSIKVILKALAPDADAITSALCVESAGIVRMFHEQGLIRAEFDDNPFSVIVQDGETFKPLFKISIDELVEQETIRAGAYENDDKAYSKRIIKDLAEEFEKVAVSLKLKADAIKVRSRADDPNEWYDDEEIAEMAKQ